MEMINTGHPNKSFWVLTVPHVKLLKKLGIRFNEIPSILKTLFDENGEPKVPVDDVVDLITFQCKVGYLFNKKENTSFLLPAEDSVYNDLIFSKIKSSLSSKSKVEHLEDLKAYQKYYGGEVDHCVVLVLGQSLEEMNSISEHYTMLTVFECQSLKPAVLKMFYHTYGYAYLHFQDVGKESTDLELSLEDVYRSLA